MGILVDDAIIIGESVHQHQTRGMTGLAGAIAGVTEVATPVVLAVLIVLIALLPGLFLPPSWVSQMMQPICLIMILTLAFSLLEALLILPAHLAKDPPHPSPLPPRETEMGGLERLRAAFNRGLDGFAPGYAQITRQDRRRVLKVQARVDSQKAAEQ